MSALAGPTPPGPLVFRPDALFPVLTGAGDHAAWTFSPVFDTQRSTTPSLAQRYLLGREGKYHGAMAGYPRFLLIRAHATEESAQDGYPEKTILRLRG